jgi:hypothetical protein
MNKKIVNKGIGIGAAAAMSITLSGCPKQADMPPPQEPDQVQVTDDTTDAPPVDTPVDTDDTVADDTAPADDASTGEIDDLLGPHPTGSLGSDECLGKDQFTEKCGYMSPTKYAVLDPGSIVNA